MPRLTTQRLLNEAITPLMITQIDYYRGKKPNSYKKDFISLQSNLINGKIRYKAPKNMTKRFFDSKLTLEYVIEGFYSD